MSPPEVLRFPLIFRRATLVTMWMHDVSSIKLNTSELKQTLLGSTPGMRMTTGGTKIHVSWRFERFVCPKIRIEDWLSFVCLLFQQSAPRLSPEYRKRLENIERQLQTLVDAREVSSLQVSWENYEFKWFLMDDQKCEFDPSLPMYARSKFCFQT